MKFVADLDINNNSHFVYSFDAAFDESIASNDLIITSDGIVFFRLSRTWPLEERAVFLVTLDKELKREFGQGLSAVTCASSDCINDLMRDNRLKKFFAAARENIPGIISILHGGQREAEESAADRHIDYQCEDNPAALRALLSLTDADTKSPPEGWDDFESKLLRLMARAQQAAEQTLGHEMAGERPLGENERFMNLLQSGRTRRRARASLGQHNAS